MKNKIFLIASFLVINGSLISQVPNYVPQNGLSGWWPFNGNADDESGNGNDGIVNGPELTEDRFGDSMKAYFFQSLNYDEISVDNSESLNITGNITISCWYKNQNNSTVSALIGMGGPIESSGYNLIANSFNTYDNNSGNWGVTSVSSPAFGRQNILIGENRAVIPQEYINLNEWNFVCCTYNGNSMKMYLNGFLLDSIICSFDLPNLTEPLLFGKERNYAPNERYFDGVIDDIGIWNRALTNDEVYKLYYDSSIQTTTDVNNTSNPFDFGGKIECYPNPTTDVINVDLSDLNKYLGQKLRIMNLSGQIVHEENVNQSKVVINVKSILTSGIYVLNTVDQNGIITSTNKFVVQ